MRSSTPLPTPPSPQQIHPSFAVPESSSSPASSSVPQVVSACSRADADVPSASPPLAVASTPAVAHPSLLTSAPHATQAHPASSMSDAIAESRDDDPSAVITASTPTNGMPQGDLMSASSSSSSSSSSAPAGLAAGPSIESAPRPHGDLTTDPDASAWPSTSASSGAQTPQPTPTVSTLQFASDALSTLPPSHPDAAAVPTSAAELLTVIHRKNKKAPAIQSPRPGSSGSARARSAATTPVPTSLLLSVKHDSFDTTAHSSRATTPTRTPSGRAKRQRRERNLGTPSASTSALPSIEQNDRRRSARVAKAVTTTTPDSSSLPNLALFGFSPYLENLVFNAKDTDRRTRSGGRGFRPPVERAPAKVKRTAPKNKAREADPDGPDDEAKSELYRQLCIISYQLQAHLDLVPHKSLAELNARFGTPSADDDDDDEANLVPASTDAANAVANPVALLNPSRAVTPAITIQKHDHYPEPSGSISSYTQHVVVKAEPPASPSLSTRQPEPSRPAYSPESSPEVALMDTVRPTYNGVPSYYPHSSQGVYQPQIQPQHEPNAWAAKVDEPEDEPMSPMFRPARSNIMSISALMSGPSPSKARSPTPELIQTPPRPVDALPMLTQEWTEDDEMASRFLQACAESIPKIDTTELDRLTQIAQLAAFDLEMLSAPSSPLPSTPSLSTPTTDQQKHDVSVKFDPRQLNPLDSLDTQELYDREEADYLEEMQNNDDLYENARYLASFDEVVDEWRAGELARLRLQLEMRKAEIERIWTCDRKLAWSTFVDSRAGGLYREAMAKASRARWQAEMEMDLLEVHRRQTRGLRKLTTDLWLPKGDEMEDEEIADIYKRYGQFVSGAKYPKMDDPLVRADVRKMRNALRAHKTLEREQQAKTKTQADGTEATEAAGATGEAVDVFADGISSYDSVSEEEFDSEEHDSDSSYVSSDSDISSLPSFSSVYSSPVVRSIADVDIGVSDLDALASEVASLADAGDESDEDADESLWARQIRLANQQAAQGLAAGTADSGAHTVIADSRAHSAMPSRAASPVVAGTAPAAKRDRKRKKRPPPPGARLWKKGRVQQDSDAVELEQQQQQQESKSELASQPGPYQNGINHHHHHDTNMVDAETNPSRVASPKLHSAREFPDYDYRSGDHRFMSQHHPSYGNNNSYGMRPSYLPGSAVEDYEYARPLHHDAYNSGRIYSSYGDPYARPSGHGGYPHEPAGYLGRPGEVNQQYSMTPPPPMMDHMMSRAYASYEHPAPPQHAYPSHPPPPLPSAAQQKNQWQQPPY
ncbi:hypothetical protein PHSY_007274 [Pseudozyma hubeiensis SY62]|uniref:Uncharacterized protein n=1 Tax=Pseudozyma hubeiensis (strain SY62) TaxID=1305764 RepID=R9PE88_PSEHS|nr:hypothetical protein PHSY_007274 [Pseudozyma hubeiensis SY62]GAC99671.1 hypothetical protein PHSY_007274 [Pseudozyma hubeiensis SY62]